jgi:transcriptional regulator GlxA family with amidase domain
MSKPIRIGIVIYKNCTSSMVTGFWDILTLANHLHGQQAGHSPFHLELIGESEKTIHSFSGLQFTATQTIRSKSKFNIIYVPGFIGEADQLVAQEQKVISWLRKVNATQTILSAACNGNFLLASSGALDHKKATTHWSLVQQFKCTFKDVTLEPEKILIDNGSVISAAGVTAYFNLALHIIQRFTNADIALACAKIFLVDAGRKLQTPYQIFQFSRAHGDEPIVKIQDWLDDNYQEKISLDKLADLGKLGKKTLLRRFKKSTGETPQVYVQKLRIETAKRLLESKDLTFNEVTWKVGYNDVSSFHKAFKQETGLTPIDYRNRFSLG